MSKGRLYLVLVQRGLLLRFLLKILQATIGVNLIDKELKIESKLQMLFLRIKERVSLLSCLIQSVLACNNAVINIYKPFSSLIVSRSYI